MSVIGSKALFLNIPSQQFAGGTNVYTMAQQVSNVNSILVTIDGIKQFSTAYTVNNFTLTFSEVVAASCIIEVVYLTSRGIVNTIADGTVTTLKYADNSITAVKVIDGNITNSKLATNSVDTTKIIDNAVTVGKIATGIVNGPAFSAYQSTTQTLPQNTITKLVFQTKEFDTNSCYSTSTNRFTPNVPGYYQISAGVQVITTATAMNMYIFKNGTLFKNISGVTVTGVLSGASALVFLNGSTDYVEIHAAQAAAAQNTSSTSAATYFQASMSRGV